MSLGGTILTYNHTQSLVVEQPLVTLVDDEIDSGSFSKTSQSSHTSTQSDFARPAKRQRTSSYNRRCSKSWQEIESAKLLSAPQMKPVSRPCLVFSFPSKPGKIAARHARAVHKEPHISSSITPKFQIFGSVKYPWDNSPIAMAIWLAQQIDNGRKGLPLEQDPPRSKAPQRPNTSGSSVKKDAALHPASGVPYFKSGTFCESNSIHKDERQTTINREQFGEKQNLSVDSCSTKFFHYLTYLEAKRIAPKLAKLKRFKPGFGDSLFNAMVDAHCVDLGIATAGKLIVNVLVVLSCPESESKCQAATDTLIELLNLESSLSPRFAKAFAILSHDTDVAEVVDITVAQINSCEFSLGLDGEFDALSGLSNYHCLNISHSPKDVNEKKFSTVPGVLENHLYSTPHRPSISSSLSSPFSCSNSSLPDHTCTKTSPISIESQDISSSNSILQSNMPPRQSNRVRKPTLRALEAKLSSQTATSKKTRAKGSKRGKPQTAMSTENIVENTCEQPSAANNDIPKMDEETPNANVTVDSLSWLPKQSAAALSADEITAPEDLDTSRLEGALEPSIPDEATNPFPKPKSTTASPRPAASAFTPPPESEAIVQKLLSLATDALKPKFKPRVPINYKHSHRIWYAKQFIAALGATSTEHPAEADTSQGNKETVPGGSSSSSPFQTSATNVDPSRTGIQTSATPAGVITSGEVSSSPNFVDALNVATKNVGASNAAAANAVHSESQASEVAESKDADQTIATKDANASDASIAGIVPSPAEASETTEPKDAGQTAIVEQPISRETFQAGVPCEFAASAILKPLSLSVLSHSYIPRPWTDKDGWVHTGLGNEHNEEKVIVPDTYTWIRPRDSLNNPRTGPSPPRMKSHSQIECDDAFGYPPPGRKPNLPQDLEGPFITEDVEKQTQGPWTCSKPGLAESSIARWL
ncbi:hypothetical protein PAAG_03228 [Paracoccidioides lutzii Pb01]|uniref:Uncharacterized protein n=1 Tax=Paracoccidioides lutzii (strain ATCC MYA-826 / Pb01) TaxID=502779 RepID=C1GXU5_PARBA|nr:hypothetical protein PAAG_03228 [Paracoccidioides lutzii Pb01]EEH41665.2 hypothetical protein PAAG_03228 [Paracoccidioides lutzii Pb01]